MQIKLEMIPGVSHSKLACVKRIKELTRLGLKESKDIVDRSEIPGVVALAEVDYNRGYIETEIENFKHWGYKLSGGRSEALDDLLGDVYIYTFEYLNRNITYKVESGECNISDGFYIINVEIGVKLDTEGSHSLNNKEIKIPVTEVSFEKSTLGYE